MNREEFIVSLQGSSFDAQCMLIDKFIKSKIEEASMEGVNKFIRIKNMFKKRESERYLNERRELFGELLTRSDDRKRYLEKQKYR